MIVHLVDGTYELFRHFHGRRRFNNGQDKPFGAVVGVLNTVLEMIENGATHIGVATPSPFLRYVVTDTNLAVARVGSTGVVGCTKSPQAVQTPATACLVNRCGVATVSGG